MVTVAGGDAEHIKKFMLDREEASKTQEDVELEREIRIRRNSMQEVTDVEGFDTQCFETRACEMEKEGKKEKGKGKEERQDRKEGKEEESRKWLRRTWWMGNAETRGGGGRKQKAECQKKKQTSASADRTDQIFVKMDRVQDASA